MVYRTEDNVSFQSLSLCYLSAIFNITDGVPVLGQWNYRILCHPIQDRLLELQHLKPVDDLSSRLRLHRNLDEFIQTRAARFQISRHSMDRATYSGEYMMIIRTVTRCHQFSGN